MEINGRFQHYFTQRGLVRLQRELVSISNLVWLGKDGGAAFHIKKAHRPAKFERQLQWIEQMKHRHIVLAKAKMLETATELLRLDEQI